MILYHGTNIDFKEIDLQKSKKGKDFGCGFYLTVSKVQALEIAEAHSLLFGGEPIIKQYYFDEKLLNNGLEFKRFDNYSLDWAEFIYANRNNPNRNNIHFYDVVYGPIADDKVGVQVRNLIEKNISLSVFMERLKFAKGITFQYFFGTEKAINTLIEK